MSHRPDVCLVWLYVLFMFSENRRCPIAQMFVECGSMCEPTCNNPAPEHCVMMCRRGCECPVDRPIRQGDNCLAKEECPGR